MRGKGRTPLTLFDLMVVFALVVSMYAAVLLVVSNPHLNGDIRRVQYQSCYDQGMVPYKAYAGPVICINGVNP